MEYRSLGKSDLLVSPIVLGTWQFDSTAWEGSNERDSIRTVHAALDLGINTVDTAEAYGESEEILGKAVEGRRDKVCIVSKANRRPEEIRSTVEQSLSRLRTDYIDVYLAHYPPKAPPYYSVLEELDRLREEGKLRALGVSNFTRYQLEQTLSVLRFDVDRKSVV